MHRREKERKGKRRNKTCHVIYHSYLLFGFLKTQRFLSSAQTVLTLNSLSSGFSTSEDGGNIRDLLIQQREADTARSLHRKEQGGSPVTDLAGQTKSSPTASEVGTNVLNPKGKTLLLNGFLSRMGLKCEKNETRIYLI